MLTASHVVARPAPPEALFDVHVSRREARKKWKIPEDAIVLGMMGRLQRQKGQHVFLRAFADAVRVLPAVHALLAGGSQFGMEPDYPGELERQAKSAGLRERVTFTGQVEEPYELLATMDVLVMPSVIDEGFGLAAAEAMALGVPVIVSDVGGLREVVCEENAGIRVPPNDSQSLARELVRLGEDTVLRQSMGERGRDCARRHHRLQSSANSLQVALEQVLNAAE
jgi:glycosyltransferase involved in cell wall biosynthesis